MTRVFLAAALAFASPAAAMTVPYYGETFGFHETADGVRCSVNYYPHVTEPVQGLYVYLLWPDSGLYQSAATIDAATWAATPRGDGKARLLAQICETVRTDMARRAKGQK